MVMPTRSATRREGRFSGRIREIKRSVFKCPNAQSRQAMAASVARPWPQKSRRRLVSDFVEALAFDLLQDDAAVADDFRNLGIRSFRQLHGPEADAVALVASTVEAEPLVDSGACGGGGGVDL